MNVSIQVKLAEPGNPEFDDSSIHWIAREHHHHPPTARHDPSTDVWAFATTAWQIFSGGEWPLKGSEIEVWVICRMSLHWERVITI